jgi:DNA polymerase III alpha subunit
LLKQLKNHNPDKAAERLDWYKRVYGENCYLEISHHPEIFGHQEIQEQIKELAQKPTLR